MRKLIILLIITFFLYFTVAYASTSFPNFDSLSYKLIGELTLRGASIYPDPAISRHPYLPLFLYFEAITLVCSSLFKIPHILVIKIILSLVHLLSIYAVFLLSKKKLVQVFFYAINPISLFITAFHGQFDIIPVTLILFAIIALQNKQFTKSIILLSFAITIKTWPILFVVPFFKRIKHRFHWYLCIVPVISLVCYSLFFRTSLFSMLRVLLVYQGVGDVWGFGKILSLISSEKIIVFLFKVFFVLSLLIYSFRQKKTRIVEEIFELLLLFFIFTPGFGLQWFQWLTPFFFITNKPFIHLFIAAITTSLVIAYASWSPFGIIPLSMVNSALFALWPLFVIYFFLFFILLKKKYTL